ncbi:MAG TPA: 8-amino-7-oxononanoate synthase, partial [Chitinophagaceae bacterium]|nr:8-amino-7-oxononanoate synthase [Chitinophagaceae bacterium]
DKDMNEEFLFKKLREREELNALRQLKLPDEGLVDFYSNDYLGISRKRLLEEIISSQRNYKYGSTGSRLLSGNYALIEETEELIARFHQAESALIFNSGYDANLGLLSSVPQRGDTILYDYLSHASIRDGIRLSLAQSYSFRHNDLADLEEKLKRTQGSVFIVTESLFSMDGDFCPLQDLVSLAEKFQANLIVDEAHATGVLGEKGEGLVQMLGLEDRVFARVHTFGKALGCHGAVILGSTALRNYLINFARSLVYSTALPEQAIAHIRASYELFPGMNAARKSLSELVDQFRVFASTQKTETGSIPGTRFSRNQAPVQWVMIPGNEEVRKAAAYLQAEGFDLRPILYPTVPKGQERLRLVLHAFNTKGELDLLLNCLKNSL